VPADVDKCTEVDLPGYLTSNASMIESFNRSVSLANGRRSKRARVDDDRCAECEQVYMSSSSTVGIEACHTVSDLKRLNISTLETRRLRGDLIQVFKIFKGLDNIQQ